MAAPSAADDPYLDTRPVDGVAVCGEPLGTSLGEPLGTSLGEPFGGSAGVDAAGLAAALQQHDGIDGVARATGSEPAEQSPVGSARISSEQDTEPTGGSSSPARDRPYSAQEAAAADPNMPPVNGPILHVAPTNRVQRRMFCQGYKSALLWLATVWCLASLGCGVLFVIIGDSSRAHSPRSGLCKDAIIMDSSNTSSCASTNDLELVNSLDACAGAATFLNVIRNDPFVVAERLCPYRPKGCFYAPGKEDMVVMFNDCPDAGLHNVGGRLICLGAELHPIEKCTWHTNVNDPLVVAGVVLLVSLPFPAVAFGWAACWALGA
eukprot:TRINITY_DN2141_c0_g1_i1.p1 TRINITY_DN2141_c0_g1~~TRINITY_DN2141_c0_g1_i1.p1  ORF type:complete len:352 (+),score=36.74 TRINITY_DN2141_c0_g1_i1:95-1057(+)